MSDSDNRLYAIIKDVLRLPLEEITDDLDMESTGAWDSLSHMQLIAGIEDEYGIELTADEIIIMRSVGQIRAVLRAHAAT